MLPHKDKRRPKEGKEKSLGSTVKNGLLGYCRNTTIHGFSYVESGDAGVDRFVWIIIVVLFFSLGGVIVQSALKDWGDNPIATTIDSFSYPVTALQFPTVTVCDTREHDRY